MRLIQYSIRPSAIIRRQAMRRGVRSNNEVVRLLALVIVGRPALIRKTANVEGLRGSSRMWRFVAVGFLLNDLYRKLAVREPDRLGTERLREGQSVTVVTMHRPTRRERRRAAS